MKHEIKVEFENSEALSKLIEKTYFEKGTQGKIDGNEHYLTVNESDEVLHTVFKGLNNATIKIHNDNVIDGSMRFMIDESSGDIRIYPVSIYCVKEQSRYSFY